jgi:Restriction endonuclease
MSAPRRSPQIAKRALCLSASRSFICKLPTFTRADKVQLLLQAVVVPGERTDEGKLIEAVAIPWFDIINELSRNPNVAFEIPPDKWEEIIAGAYRRAGFERVILTPRSGDYGRDVIATKHGLGYVRVIDQVKAFKPPNLVTADHVRALMGVLQMTARQRGFLQPRPTLRGPAHRTFYPCSA